MPKRKVGRSGAEATLGQGECSRPWQGTLPPPMPKTVGWPCVDPPPPPILGLEEVGDEVDVETVFSDYDDLSCGQSGGGAEDGSSSTPHFNEVIGRAARALGVAPPDDLMAPTSRFEEVGEVRPVPVRVPLLPDFEELVCGQFASPAASHRWSSSCRRFSDMTDRERVACGPLPQIDPALSPLISPSGSFLGKTSCPSRNCRLMDDLLGKLHRAMATQTRLSNTGAIMSLYLRDLSKKVQEGPGGSDVADATYGCPSLSSSKGIGTVWSGCQWNLRPCLVRMRLSYCSRHGRIAAPHKRCQASPGAPGAPGGLEQPSVLSRPRHGVQGTSGPSWRLFVGVTPAIGGGGGARLRGPPSARPPPDYPKTPACQLPLSTVRYRDAWAALGADPWVVSTMTHGYRLQFSCRPPLARLATFTTVTNHQHAEVMRGELSSLLEKHAIREVKCGDHRAGFFSRYFLVPKRDGGLRPILDLRVLNKHLRPLRCRMLTIPRVRQAVTMGDWFATVDLKDAYFQIPIWPGHWRFLRFGFEGRRYEFQVLPFGISLAPRTFTRCMDAVLAPLRLQGLRILNYLDDWLVCAASEELCHHHVALLLEHIQALGLRLNYRKSKLQPSQVTTFLGTVLDSRRAVITLTQERQQAFSACLGHFQLRSRVSWGLCLRLMGLMAAMVQVVPLALLYMRPVQRCLLGLGLCPQMSRRITVVVSRRLHRALSWWRDPANLANGSALGPVVYRQLVFTDASQIGWGAVHEGCGVNNRWSGRWMSQHINVLELKAVLLALREFLPRLRGHHVIVRTDSTVAAAYINRQGGLGSPVLCKLATTLWQWAHPLFCSLRAVHVPGPLNTAADLMSRGGPTPGEWRLHPQVVEEIWRRFGRADVDLFASRESTHCRLFFSLKNDNPPLGWDALAHPWPRGLLYAFPPFTLLQPLLYRIRAEGARVILVAPLWPHMLWFSAIPHLLDGTPWVLPLRRDLLSQASGALFHPFPAGLRLVAWPLRGTGSWL
ncbi:uncharacterized protein LOC133442594 [Cololabis saira]|uniref:uncharacterized protein LOC133442594 n=1 Tax=Cololabis saira TaxID=129043 RepID=UPI002AD35856|nr:uncharacterized protein LOC133442594 [Cololabis saira]